MRTKSFIPLLGFILLLMAESCTDPIEVNPNYNPETNSVTTQLVFNIAAADKAETKQTATTTQQPNSTTGKISFRGINNATLFGFKQATDGKKVLSPGQSDVVIDLSTALGTGSIDETKSNRILEASLPIGVNSLILYGMATRGSGASNAQVGSLEYIYSSNINEIGSFASPRLDPRNTSDVNSFDQVEEILLCIMNRLTRIGVKDIKIGEYDFSSLSEDKRTLYWADFQGAENEYGGAGISPVEKVFSTATTTTASQLELLLGKAYNSLVTISGDAYRAGSGGALYRQLEDLLSVMSDASSSAPTNNREAVAKVIISAIVTFVSPMLDLTNGEWKDLTTVFNAVKSFPEISTTTLYDSQLVLSDFPANFYLPNGSTTLRLKANEKSYYDITTALGYSLNKVFTYTPDESDVVNIREVYKYTYSPELCYYCNSPIRISANNNLKNTDYPNGVTNWSAGSNWSTTIWEPTFGHVESSTRGVAMAFNVQYAMSNLKTRIKFDALEESGKYYLFDNNHAIHDAEEDNKIEISNSSYITLKGVLIAGQPSIVNWLYIPWSGFSNTSKYPYSLAFDRIIYDTELNSTADGVSTASFIPIEGGWSLPNYTLTFDNYDSSKAIDAQSPVYVALEFENHLGDFWGKGNMVRDGGTFYLIALLDPANPAQGSTITWPDADDAEGNMLPPYDGNGLTVKAPRVFIQDHQTIADFTLKQTCLKYAYVTVPDLRASKLSLGVSVDLRWRDGLTFGVDIGGDQPQN